jgi:hypothetical protein
MTPAALNSKPYLCWIETTRLRGFAVPGWLNEGVRERKGVAIGLDPLSREKEAKERVDRPSHLEFVECYSTHSMLWWALPRLLLGFDPS